KKILLCTDGSPFAETIYLYGAWFASRLAAGIDILFVTDIRTQQSIASSNLSGSIGIDASEVLLSQLVELEHQWAKLNHQRAKLVLQKAEACLKELGIDQVNLLHETGFLVDCFHEFEDQADLVMLGKRGETAQFAAGHLGANVERILRSSHKPCLVTPQDFQPIERLLLAYDGSKSCQRILEFLAQSTLFQGLELHILTVAKSADHDAAIAQIQEAEDIVRPAGFKPISQVLQGDSETAIANYVTEHHITLLLMGAYGHSRIRHLVIGSTTSQILRSTLIPVLVFR
ncbi:MAG TPA: universal stress protein, partial [Candidatus Obscuribacterales bacterium]